MKDRLGPIAVAARMLALSAPTQAPLRRGLLLLASIRVCNSWPAGLTQLCGTGSDYRGALR
jgi:hypothetical protein